MRSCRIVFLIGFFLLIFYHFVSQFLCSLTDYFVRPSDQFLSMYRLSEHLFYTLPLNIFNLPARFLVSQGANKNALTDEGERPEDLVDPNNQV